MNTKKITDLAVLCITIILANILVELITDWAGRFINTDNVYKSNAISMAVLVLVYYPSFKALNSFLKDSAKKYITKTKKAAGGNFIGILVGFFFALFLLYFINLKVRYGIDIVEQLLHQ